MGKVRAVEASLTSHPDSKGLDSSPHCDYGDLAVGTRIETLFIAKPGGK